jgi:hypothetical protein
MNFATVKSLTIPEGAVSRVLIGGKEVWKKSPLPTGFTLLEYIETDDAQYIDTGFIPNNNSRVVADFISTLDDDYNDVLGCRSTTSSRGFAFSTTGTKWRFGYGKTVETSTPWDTERHLLDMDKNVRSLDGEAIHTADVTEFTCAYSLALGAIKSSKMYLGDTGFYSCQIYDNGTLVRDLIPCKNKEGEAGMYDKVNKVFYGNAGTGTFITG